MCACVCARAWECVLGGREGEKLMVLWGGGGVILLLLFAVSEPSVTDQGKDTALLSSLACEPTVAYDLGK